MEHVAIDLGGRESQLCVRRADGTVREERRCATASLRGVLKKLPRSRVVMETCAESFAVAEMAREAGHEVRVVPATLVRTLGVGARRVKTDRKDAQVLSEVSCRIDLPSVHLRSEASRDLRSVLSMRDGLVQARTQLVNTVRGWLRTKLIRVTVGAVETFPERLRKAVRGELGEVPAFVERQLVAIEALSEQLAAATADVEAAAAGDAVCERLQSVPGVGPMTAAAFRSTVDEVERFASAHHVQSYVGLTPSEHSSSDKQRRGSITKAGSAMLRRYLVQAGWALWRSRPADPLVTWAKRVAERRGRAIAIVALARKLAGILYALWRDGSTYRPRPAPEPRLAA